MKSTAGVVVVLHSTVISIPPERQRWGRTMGKLEGGDYLLISVQVQEGKIQRGVKV